MAKIRIEIVDVGVNSDGIPSSVINNVYKSFEQVVTNTLTAGQDYYFYVEDGDLVSAITTGNSTGSVWV